MPVPVLHRVPLLILLLILVWGTWIRLSQLGSNPLSSDEMNHYYVAAALRDGQGPVLPSGVWYGRGLEYSEMVRASLDRTRTVETAVRLPAAIIGTLCLVAFALIAWNIAGPWPAVIATLLLALYPEAVRLSRFGRFYTLQLLVGLLAMYAGWRVLRDPLEAGDFRVRRLAATWGWALATLLAFGYATRIQVTTLSVAAGWAVLVAVVGVLDLHRHRSAAWRWSVSWQLTVLGILALLALSGLVPHLVGELIQRARAVPLWARLGNSSTVMSYYRALSTSFPLVISLSPLIFLIVILRHWRTGWFLLAWFAIPVLLHSLVFTWKSERYILLAVPALFLAAGIAAAAGVETLSRWLSHRLQQLTPAWAHGLATVMVGSVAVVALVTTPAFNTSRRIPSTRVSNGWDESKRIIMADPDLARLPLGSAMPLETLHYWGRLDFVVQKALLESWTDDPADPENAQPYHMNPVGSPDLYAGRPTLTTPEAIEQAFAARGAVLIGIQQKYWDYNNVEQSLKTTLERKATELCHERCGTLRLYYWRFQP
jgi:hypothetical protein